jgi:hypothetical protein
MLLTCSVKKLCTQDILIWFEWFNDLSSLFIQYTRIRIFKSQFDCTAQIMLTFNRYGDSKWNGKKAIFFSIK